MNENNIEWVIPNKYKGICCKCNVEVEANKGWLKLKDRPEYDKNFDCYCQTHADIILFKKDD